MKQSVDDKTKELAVTLPYLVISQTKKGFREFRRHEYYRYTWKRSWTWTKGIEQAERYKLEELPDLIKLVASRRTACACLVLDGELHVLGVRKYPMPAGQPKRCG